MIRFLLFALSLTLLLAACDSAPQEPGMEYTLEPMTYLDTQCGDWYTTGHYVAYNDSMASIYWNVDYDLQNNGLCPSLSQYIYGGLIVADAGDCGLGGWPELLALPDTTYYDPDECKYYFETTFKWLYRFPEGKFWILPGMKINCNVGGDHFIWGSCTEIDVDPEPPGGGGKGDPRV